MNMSQEELMLGYLQNAGETAGRLWNLSQGCFRDRSGIFTGLAL